MAPRTKRSDASTVPKNEFPTPAERRFLQWVYRYTLDHGQEYPNDAWLMDKLGLGSSGVSTVKGRLKEKDFLVKKTGTVEFTEKGWQYCRTNILEVASVRVRIYGNVRAGKINHDTTEAVVEGWQEHDQEAELISIPFEGGSREIFALRVVGQSMEHERVFEGDIVIVEKFGRDEIPRVGEMIVTHYLPIADEAAAQENPDDVTSYLVGPVLKFLHEENAEKDERRRYILGWRRDRQASPDQYRIQTRYIKPVGRVVAVYRAVSW